MLLPTIHRGRSLGEPFDRIQRDFDRFMRRFWEGEWPESMDSGEYPVDIWEDDKNIHVDAELPGFKRDEIDVNLSDDTLRIKAERKAEDIKGKKYLNERCYTRVERVFSLPTPIDDSKVEGKLDQGILHLVLAKSADSKKKRIEIQ